MSRRRVLLYADVDLNIIDGSSVWLVSMAEALSLTASDVDVLLKAPVVNGRLSDALAGLDHVTVVGAGVSSGRRSRDDAALTPDEAAQRLARLDAAGRYDAVVCRGIRVCRAAAAIPALRGRLWPYMTEVPQTAAGMTAEVRESLAEVARAARRVFAQTEDARGFLEHHVPEAAGKVVLLPPMIPGRAPRGAPATTDAAGTDAPTRAGDATSSLRLVYAGKLAKNWRTLEMCALPARAAARGFDVHLTVVGDKFHNDPTDPGWVERMRAALDGEGITWLGGMSRAEALEALSGHDLGLGWRAPALDASHELSTKILEYAWAGVPPVVNRTAAHEELLGADYPLFVDDATVLDVLERVASDPALVEAARRAVAQVASRFTIAEAGERLEALLRRAGPIPASANGGRTRVLVASHDLKFAADVLEYLDRREDVEVAYDVWRTLHEHDAAASRDLLEQADVVLCEWAGPNAVWYSRNKRPDQRLVVRLHMFELGGPWLPRIQWDAVDALVCVSEYYADVTAQAVGLDRSRITVIPNTVDVADLDRPKAADARFHLGFVGLVPVRKRPDRALDLLERLLRHDERFTLHIRGRLPNEYPWEWSKPVVRGYYAQQLRRLMSPELAGRVSLDDFGADIGNWLRKIGWVLSPSTDESFHLAPMEGMASGAVPVLWERPGAADIFGGRWLHPSTEHAAEFVRATAADPARWSDEVQAARAHADGYDAPSVHGAWSVLLGPAACASEIGQSG